MMSHGNVWQGKLLHHRNVLDKLIQKDYITSAEEEWIEKEDNKLFHMENSQKNSRLDPNVCGAKSMPKYRKFKEKT